MMQRAVHVVCLTGAILAPACARPELQAPDEAPRGAAEAPMQQLWRQPADVTRRNLFWGPGRARRAPAAGHEYRVLREDDSGYSPGYDVVGPDGRTWDIKLGREVQSEIAVSRLLWAVGYHQPETYLVTDWRLAGEWKDEGAPARFRLQSGHESDGEWAWRDNPFANTRQLHGLVAINVLLGNWDFKSSNNRIYRVLDGRRPRRRYVVQDLGASLGKPRVFPLPIGSRNDIDDFEDTRLVRRATADRVILDYRGLHTDVLEEMQAADVVWACTLLNRLTNAQMADAFRAAGYDSGVTARFVAKIRAKIAEGLALRSAATDGVRP